jgi:cell division protein FtsB
LLLFVYEVVNNRAELRRSNEILAALQEQERLVNIDNGQLRRYSDDENLDDYLDRHARDEMGYADPLERVYYVAQGD